MTKALVAAGLAVLALALLPTAAAHGAPPVRAIDARVLVDDDGLLGYNGGGLDVLALDLREAAFPDGGHALVFRFIVQSDAAPAGQSLAASFSIAGSARTLAVATADGATYSSTDFDRVEGPFDVGDGHPKAIDAWIRAEALGVSAGDTLASLSVGSLRDEAPDDVMPGGWFLQGQEVQPVSAPGAEAGSPADYTLSGPAALVTLAATPTAATAPAEVTVRIANPTDTVQFADLSVAAADGMAARLEQRAVSLDAGASREVTLILGNATASGGVELVATTDLGGHAVLRIPVTAAPVPTAGNGTTMHEGHGHDHMDMHGPEDVDSKDTPAPAGVLVALGLLALALRRR